MGDGSTNLFGIVIPSTNPVFLTVVGVHILLGLACTVTGAAAMLSQKRRGRHPRYGTIYYWCLAGVFLTAASLAAVRWAEDYHLFILGALSMAAAYLGRGARRYRWRSWVRLHITGMGASYVLLLIAFYVDNGHSLPLWKELPPIAYWLLPAAIGIPLIVRALLWHPLARQPHSGLKPDIAQGPKSAHEQRSFENVRLCEKRPHATWGLHAMTPSVRARTSGEARQVATAS